MSLSGGLPTYFKLFTGALIPSLGFGTWQAAKGQVGNAVAHALRTGYRHINCAYIYGNEAEVGAAIRDSGIPRSELWITGKLWNGYHRPEDGEAMYQLSVRNLNAEYLDLYLMHWPVAFGLGADGKPGDRPKDKDGNLVVDYALTEDYVTTWRAMEALVGTGGSSARHIGISSFNIRKWKHLLSQAKVQPAVNQVEMNFHWPQHGLVQWAKENGQLLEAYSPLGSGERAKVILADPIINEIATKHGVGPSRILLSWQIQRGVRPPYTSLSHRAHVHLCRTSSLPWIGLDPLAKKYFIFGTLPFHVTFDQTLRAFKFVLDPNTSLHTRTGRLR